MVEDAVHDTLTIIMAARPKEDDVMFPDYHDSKRLCDDMAASLLAWDDRQFVDAALVAFRRGDVREGMMIARERVHFYLPSECNWAYLDDRSP